MIRLARLGDLTEASDTLDAMERETTNPSLLGDHFQALRRAVERQEADTLLDEWKDRTIGKPEAEGQVPVT